MSILHDRAKGTWRVPDSEILYDKDLCPGRRLHSNLRIIYARQQLKAIKNKKLETPHKINNVTLHIIKVFFIFLIKIPSIFIKYVSPRTNTTLS